MFPTLRISARAILVAGLVGGFALVTPTGAHSQTIIPERALLNHVEGTAFAPVTAAPAPVAEPFLDGDRALLNHSRASVNAPVAAIVSDRSVVVDGQYPTGVKALLNRSRL